MDSTRSKSLWSNRYTWLTFKERHIDNCKHFFISKFNLHSWLQANNASKSLCKISASFIVVIRRYNFASKCGT